MHVGKAVEGEGRREGLYIRWTFILSASLRCLRQISSAENQDSILTHRDWIQNLILYPTQFDRQSVFQARKSVWSGRLASDCRRDCWARNIKLTFQLQRILVNSRHDKFQYYSCDLLLLQFSQENDIDHNVGTSTTCWTSMTGTASMLQRNRTWSALQRHPGTCGPAPWLTSSLQVGLHDKYKLWKIKWSKKSSPKWKSKGKVKMKVNILSEKIWDNGHEPWWSESFDIMIRWS